ncbi:hypothetical protein [Streptomyces sp. NBC_00620]|uniref:hypothetical protein n=1 Tax=Streptomyces sp. NBC_00620 TaxID=2903666 RepID=UPI0022554EBB|nr:hypothetical protein [Streptomyces sp. NBC_00620]MCX4976259.1 hypothetical protein [Streptomyces sp. NBC_00620]
MEEVEAKECISTIDNAQAMAKNYNAMFFDAWHSWNRDFAGRYDSPEAAESKQFYKNHIKKLFADVISSADPGMKQVCRSSTSLADILIMPNYDAW